MAASEDALFMVVGDTCTILNAATGAVRARVKSPESTDDVERSWGYVGVHDGLLLGSSTIRTELADSLRRRGINFKSATDALFAVDVKTGQRLWTYRGKNVMHVTVTVGDGRVYFVDAELSKEEREAMLAEDKTELAKLTGKARDKAEAEIKRRDLRLAVALDLKTGKLVWQKPVDVTDCSYVGAGGGNLCMMLSDGKLVLCGANANGHYWSQFLSGQFKRRRIVVLDAASGEKLWAKDANYQHRPIVVDKRIIAQPWAFDLATGEQIMRTHPLTGEQTPWQFTRPGHYCGMITSTPNMLFFRSQSIGYYDLLDDSGTRHFAGQRSGCWVNVIPAGGLLVVPESSAGCVCLHPITSTVVMEPRTDRGQWGIYSASGAKTPIKQIAINLGAPGDRRDETGKIWFAYPRPSAINRLEFTFDVQTKLAPSGEFYNDGDQPSGVAGAKPDWVFASGARGLLRCDVPLLGKKDDGAEYSVTLHFRGSDGAKPGESSFAVRLQGETVADDLDFAAGDDQAGKAESRTFKGVKVDGRLRIELVPKASADAPQKLLPNLVGVEIERS
jgi:outer membrane protein assembly factor BamB